jgi:hypothetical protein
LVSRRSLTAQRRDQCRARVAPARNGRIQVFSYGGRHAHCRPGETAR